VSLFADSQAAIHMVEKESGNASDFHAILPLFRRLTIRVAARRRDTVRDTRHVLTQRAARGDATGRAAKQQESARENGAFVSEFPSLDIPRARDIERTQLVISHAFRTRFPKYSRKGLDNGR